MAKAFSEQCQSAFLPHRALFSTQNILASEEAVSMTQRLPQRATFRCTASSGSSCSSCSRKIILYQQPTNLGQPSLSSQTIPVLYPVPRSQEVSGKHHVDPATETRTNLTRSAKLGQHNTSSNVAVTAETTGDYLNVISKSSPSQFENSDTESVDSQEFSIPAFKDSKKYCKLRWMHSLECFVLGRDIDGSFKCCKLWQARKATSCSDIGYRNGSKIRTFALLDRSTYNKRGPVLTCLLDTGCDVRGIIRSDKAKSLGWRPKKGMQRAWRKVKIASGHELTPIGRMRLLAKDSRTGVLIDHPFYVVPSSSLPIAECILGNDIVQRKHFECPNKMCLTRYYASRPGK